MKEASQLLVSAVFTRHPFHRLVSGYRDKIARRNTRFFPPVRKYIVETYRSPDALLLSHIGIEYFISGYIIPALVRWYFVLYFVKPYFIIYYSKV